MTLYELETELIELDYAREAIDIRRDKVAKQVERVRIEALAEAERQRRTRKSEYDRNRYEGKRMKPSTILATALRRADRHTRYCYEELDAAKKLEVEAAYRRHLLACERTGTEPEPRYLDELIPDILKDRHEPDSFSMRAAA